MIEIKVELNLNNKSIDVSTALRNLGRNIKNEFMQEYQFGAKTGRLYGKHRASAPNETPAKISGNLGEKFIYISRPNELDLIDNSGYGGYLEFGTKYIKPRNGVISAINNNLKRFENELSKNNKFFNL